MSELNAQIISMQEIAKHCHLNDCWVVLYNKVYDLTSYLQHHPGGISVILNHAGTDVTWIFESVHSKTILSTLPSSCCIGIIKNKSVDKTDVISKESILTKYIHNDKLHNSLSVIPGLNEFFNVSMFKKYAIKMMKPRALNYCIPGADDEITLRENHEIYSKILLRPRCSLNYITTDNIDINCDMFGINCSMPLFLSPTGLNKLFHRNGELSVINACYNENIIPSISTFSSYSMKEIFKYSNIISNGKQNICYDLYICQDDNVTKEMILEALKYRCNIFIITVDTPQVGRREKDIRYNLKLKALNDEKDTDDAAPHIVKDLNMNKNINSWNVLHHGTAGRLSSFINPSLTWNDIVWIRSFIDNNNNNKNGGAKLILKGIQCFEDVLKIINEYNHIIDGIILSNHGGRQLDTARTSIEILQEIMNNIDLEKRKNIEIYIDGGIMNGFDIFKALTIGAKGVGIGRAYLYGMTCYGGKGIQQIIKILKNELIYVMKLMGISSLKNINRSCIINNCLLSINDHHTMSKI